MTLMHTDARYRIMLDDVQLCQQMSVMHSDFELCRIIFYYDYDTPRCCAIMLVMTNMHSDVELCRMMCMAGCN